MSSAVDEVLRSIDYRTFYRRNIPDFSVNGKADVLCHCVFHKDTKPSLSVNIETGLFFCHACGEKGNAVQFIQKKEGPTSKQLYSESREIQELPVQLRPSEIKRPQLLAGPHTSPSTR